MAAPQIRFPEWMEHDSTWIRFAAALGGQIYRITFRWDPRIEPARVMREGEDPQTGGWRMDLRTNTGEPILLGRKLVLADDLWELFHYIDGVPTGALRVRRRSTRTDDPGLYDLGGDVVIEYVE